MLIATQLLATCGRVMVCIIIMGSSDRENRLWGEYIGLGVVVLAPKVAERAVLDRWL
jgi:hypothetical protein